jgi:hypothetical protein
MWRGAMHTPTVDVLTDEAGNVACCTGGAAKTKAKDKASVGI